MYRLNRFPRLLFCAAIVALAACGGSDTTDPPIDDETDGYLWHTAGSAIAAFTLQQTGFTNTEFPALDLQFGSAVGHTLGDLALDRSGNIWAVGVGSNRVFRFPADNTSGVITPDLIISSTDLREPAGIAFDQAGNLYVVNANSSTAGNNYASIVRFNNVLGLNGNQTLAASLVINPPATGTITNYFGLVHNLAFSSTGDLYVAGPSTILRFINPGSLTGAIIRTPDGVILSSGYVPPVGFSGMLAFDDTGALWVTGSENSADFLMKFVNPVYAGVSSPPPNVRLTLGNQKFANGMAFDADDNLWVILDASSGKVIAKYANPKSLVNGAATPVITLRNTTFSGIGKLAFFPTPFGLPVY